MSGTVGSPRQEALSLALQPGGAPVQPGFVLGPFALAVGQVLPALSALLSLSAQTPRGTKRVTVWIRYTRGAAGGFPGLRMLYAHTLGGTFHAAPIVDLASFLAAAPLGQVNFYEEELKGPVPADANPLAYELTFEVPANTIQFELQARELGAPATPGTLSVDWTGDG